MSEYGAWKLLGPDGQPMVTGGTYESPMSKAQAQEVAKRVRSKGTSLSVAVDRQRGRDKPTPVTYDTLRLMARRNEWVRAALNVRARQLRGKKWKITVREADPSGAAAKAAQAVTKLLERPQLHGSQPDAVHWQQWISMWLEDLLSLDRACFEKERDGQKWIKALYVVDGATIRPNLDDRGAYFYPDSYVQIIDGLPETHFGMEDLSVTMDNPQSDIRFKGYGLSPLESLIVSVTADLHAAKYNADYFTKGSVPEGLLHLGEDIDPELVDAFRLYWLNEIQGKPHALPIMGGSKAPEFLQWRQPNRDMQFMEYQQWLQQKICAVFCMSPKELGSIADVNRSTAEDASESDDQKGVEPLADLVKNMVDLDIIGEMGFGLGDYLEFDWEEAGENAEQINAKMQPMHAAGVASGAEWREAHGMDPDGDPKATHGRDGLRMHLAGGQPLPSREDADTLGSAHQQDREDQQGDLEHQRSQETAEDDHHRQMDAKSAEEGGEASDAPWQPANGDDPDVKAAQQSHDEENGIGPRNVKKTRSVGPSTGDPARVAKAMLSDHDRNPPMTRAENDLVSVFDKATEKLVAGLSEVLKR